MIEIIWSGAEQMIDVPPDSVTLSQAEQHEQFLAGLQTALQGERDLLALLRWARNLHIDEPAIIEALETHFTAVAKLCERAKKGTT